MEPNTFSTRFLWQRSRGKCAILMIMAATFAPVQARSQSRFDGAFAALTTGYDIAARNHPSAQYFTVDPFSAKPMFTGEQSGSRAGFDSITSPRIGLSAGYNATSGTILIGFEARAAYAFSDGRSGYSIPTYGPQIPFVVQSASCFMACSAPFQLSGPQQGIWPIGASTYRFSERFARPITGDLAMRAGFTLGDWMIFGKAGGGVEQSKYVSVSDESGRTDCVNPFYTVTQTSPTSYSVSVTSCGAIANGGRTVTTRSTISPYAILGAGFERNFGNWFARVEAEISVHFPYQIREIYYVPTASLAVGYRF